MDNRRKGVWGAVLCIAGTVLMCADGAGAQEYDTIVRRGTVYDGSGGAPLVADVGIRGDRIVHVGKMILSDWLRA